MIFPLTPCNHYWLEVATVRNKRIAICKFCKKKGTFDLDGWELVRALGHAVNKPRRL